jgi:multiple sugar transport system substrate-binding protein
MTRRSVWVPLMVTGALVLAACGNSNNASPSSTSAATSSQSAQNSAPAASSSGTENGSSPSSGGQAGSSASSGGQSGSPGSSDMQSSSSPADSASSASSSGSAAGGGTPLPNTGKPIDVMGWTTGDEVGTSRVDYVKKQDPSLTIKVDENGFDQQKFATAMGGGSAPAGVNMDRQLLATYAQKGFLQPLDDCIAANGIDMSQFYPDSVAEATWNGHVYGIPEFYTVRAVMINNRVLSGAGLTAADLDTSNWDGIKNAATKMYKESGGKPTTIGFDPKLPEFLPLWTMINGGSIVSADGKPTLNDPKVVEALKFGVDLVNAQGGWANFKSFRDTWDFFGAGNQFAKGKDQIGAMPFEQWYVNVLAGFGDSIDLSAAPIKAKDGSAITMASGSAFAIPKDSPNVGGMCAFMKLVTSQGAWDAAGAARQAKVAKDKSIFTGLFTANKAANDALQTKYVKPSANKKIDAVIKVFYDSLGSAKTIPPSPAGQDIQNAYNQAVTDAFGGADPQQVLDDAQQTAQNAYDDAMG